MSTPANKLYKEFVEDGLSPRAARIRALVESVREDEQEKEDLLTYSSERLKIATVHAREDICLIVAQNYEIIKLIETQNSIQKLTLLAILAVVVAQFLG
jgi:hypothetical protein